MVMNHEVEIPMVISQEPEISADPGSTNDLTSPPPSFLTPSPTNSAGKSFRDILVTPHGSKGSSKKPRRKALNSSAVVVTKCLFKQTKASNKRKNLKKTSKSKHYQPSLQDLSDAGSSNVNLGDPSSWYCKVCQEDRELEKFGFWHYSIHSICHYTVGLLWVSGWAIFETRVPKMAQKTFFFFKLILKCLI
uniref:Uncharacterized protein n=1 Tax=Cacopsylla melanoneura TaxID=428564 RepID=A0A8D8QH34_9HEMI